MSDQVAPKKKVYKQLERVSIADGLMEKLNALTDQANQSLLGVATITRSDIINLTLGRREPVLSKVEIEELKTVHFDVFKYLTWLQGQAKSAKENGTDLTLKELLERSSGVIDGVASKRSPKKPKTEKSPTAPLENSTNKSSTLRVNASSPPTDETV